jgi:hypothetical protein
MNSAAAAWSSRRARLRQGLVGDLPDEHVLEGVLRVSADARDGFAAQKPAMLERVQHLRDPVAVGVQPLERSDPEDLSDRGRGEDDRRSRLRKGVEPRRDDVPHRGGSFASALGRVLADRGRELLDEERVSLGRLRQPRRSLAQRRLPSRRSASSSAHSRPSGSRASAVYDLSPLPQPGLESIEVRAGQT